MACRGVIVVVTKCGSGGATFGPQRWDAVDSDKCINKFTTRTSVVVAVALLKSKVFY